MCTLLHSVLSLAFRILFIYVGIVSTVPTTMEFLLDHGGSGGKANDTTGEVISEQIEMVLQNALESTSSNETPETIFEYIFEPADGNGTLQNAVEYIPKSMAGDGTFDNETAFESAREPKVENETHVTSFDYVILLPEGNGTFAEYTFENPKTVAPEVTSVRTLDVKPEDEFPYHLYNTRWHSNETSTSSRASATNRLCKCSSEVPTVLQGLGFSSKTGTATPPLDPQRQEWTEWSECKPFRRRYCYRASQTRTRLCGFATSSGKTDPNNECISTNARNCLHMSSCVQNWHAGPYSECSKECGSGTKSRLHMCTRNSRPNTRCFGGMGQTTAEEVTECNTHACPHWSTWQLGTLQKAISDAIKGRVRGQIKVTHPQMLYRICVYKGDTSVLCNGTADNETYYQWKLAGIGTTDTDIYDPETGERVCKTVSSTTATNAHNPREDDYTENLTTITLTIALSVACIIAFALVLGLLAKKRKSYTDTNITGSSIVSKGTIDRTESASPSTSDVVVRFHGTIIQFWNAVRVTDLKSWEQRAVIEFVKEGDTTSTKFSSSPIAINIEPVQEHAEIESGYGTPTRPDKISTLQAPVMRPNTLQTRRTTPGLLRPQTPSFNNTSPEGFERTQSYNNLQGKFGKEQIPRVKNKNMTSPVMKSGSAGRIPSPEFRQAMSEDMRKSRTLDRSTPDKSSQSGGLNFTAPKKHSQTPSWHDDSTLC